jgi:hypothetical protein
VLIRKRQSPRSNGSAGLLLFAAPLTFQSPAQKGQRDR